MAWEWKRYQDLPVPLRPSTRPFAQLVVRCYLSASEWSDVINNFSHLQYTVVFSAMVTVLHQCRAESKVMARKVLGVDYYSWLFCQSQPYFKVLKGKDFQSFKGGWTPVSNGLRPFWKSPSRANTSPTQHIKSHSSLKKKITINIYSVYAQQLLYTKPVITKLKAKKM